MTRTDFMAELRHLLRALPQAEIDEALSYYAAYLDDAEDENLAIAELGSPKEVAGLIIAELASSPDPEKARSSGGIRNTRIILLTAFASPVLIPVAIAALVCVIALLVVLLALFAVSGALLLLGAASLLLSIAVIAQDFAFGLSVAGMGLVALGLGWLMLRGMTWLWRVSFNWFTRQIGRFILRKREKA
jgi:uncharacterized membrane protein